MQRRSVWGVVFIGWLRARSCDGNERGSVHVFKLDSDGGWVKTQQVQVSPRAVDERFGYAAAIHGHRAWVRVQGKLGVYEFDTKENPWRETQTLAGSDFSNTFGLSVDLRFDYAVVGAHGAKDAAHLFERDADGRWIARQKTLASDRASDDNFGYSVSISKNLLFVEVHSDHDPQDSGAAYMHQVNR